MSSKYPSWYRSRGYLHFDLPIGYKKACAIVKNSKRIATHAFYPFINYTLTAEKITKDPASHKLINKPKDRPIAYASHIDSHIFAFYSALLSDRYEEELRQRNIGDSILAFRSLGKSNIEFAKEAFDHIRSLGKCGVVALDITGFFDNLNHSILKQKWAALLNRKRLPADHYNIFKAITKWSSVERKELYKTLSISKHNPKHGRYRVCSPVEFRDIIRGNKLIKKNNSDKGIPQGSPISAFLSNIYMIDFDQHVSDLVASLGGRYVRYCDDMLVIVPLEWRDKIAGEIVKRIKALKIDINPKKTEIRTFERSNGKIVADKPLQYLGFLFDGEQVIIRSSALARYSERMKRGVQLAKSTKIKRNRLKLDLGRKPTRLYKHKLYEKYSHLGQRNFVRYGFRAAKIMNSKAIKRQLKPLWRRLLVEIEK